jgi:hypothetical protein
MIILPVTYLGGVEWFMHLAKGDCVIDIGENWVKQTARNRAEILAAGGVAALTVPVHGGGQKIAIRDVRIDNTKRWQHNHWQSVVSAYRNSPFFDHYEERFAPFYTRKFDFLADLNLELLDVLLSVLKLPGVAVKISEDWVAAAPGDLDLRGKKALRRAEVSACNPNGDMSRNSTPDPAYNSIPDALENRALREYTQVFSDRMPFTPGLSIVDLLFCEGPSAIELLR